METIKKRGGDIFVIKPDIVVESKKRTSENEKMDNVFALLNGTPAVFNPEAKYIDFWEKERKRKATVKMSIIIAVAVITLLVGTAAVVAKNKWWFTRIFQSNRIEYNTSGTSTDIIKIDSNNKAYDSLESLEQDLNCSIPKLAELPEELIATSINMEDYGDIILIKIMYQNNENVNKIQLTYQYFKTQEDSTSVYEPNPRYFFEGEFDILGNKVAVFNDMDWCTAFWTYSNFTIFIETKYNKNELEAILQNIRI